MKKKFRDNKGSISALVVISVLLYSIVLSTAYSQISAKRKMQIESQILAKEAYEKQLDNLDEIRDEINGGSSSILSKLKIGDYVNYTYDTAGSYSLSSTYSGYNSNQTITQDTTLTWQVLSVDKENNTVDIISTNPTGTSVWFKGALGYNNGPYLMNAICEAQYSNKTLGVKARNISLLDIEKQLTTAGIAARNAYTNAVKYGTTRTYTDDYSYYPLLYDGQKGAGVNVTEAEASTKITQPKTDAGNDPYGESVETTSPLTEKTSKQADSKALTVTQTFYYIPISKDNYGDAASVLSSSNYYWVSARYVQTDSSNARFGLRFAGTLMYGSDMFVTHSIDGSTYNCLRPVVSLSSSLLTGEKTNDAWNLSK